MFAYIGRGILVSQLMGKRVLTGILFISIFAVLVLSLSSCSSIDFEYDCIISAANRDFSSNSENLETIELVVDATESMSGYIAESTSNYRKTLPLLEQTASDLGPREIKYFRYGTARFGIQASPTFSRAISRPSFYDREADLTECEMFYLDSSELYAAFHRNVISTNQNNESSRDCQTSANIEPSIDRNVLTVITTDLNQPQYKISKSIGYLNSYIEEGLSVGVLGVKSQFEGTLSDLNESSTTFTVSTQGEQSFPFYILMIGTYDHVINYFSALQKIDPEIIKLQNFSLFTRSYPLEPSFFTFDQPDTTFPSLPNRAVQRISQFKSGNFRGSIKDNSSIAGLRLNTNRPDDINIDGFQVNIDYPSYLPEIDFQSSLPFDIEKNYFHFDETSKTLRRDSPLDSRFTISGIKLGDKSESTSLPIDVAVKIKPLEYDNKPTFIELSLFPSQLINPDWWNEWSFRDSQLPDNEFILNTSKTLNLERFLSQIYRNTTYSQNRITPLSKLCFLIQNK